MQLTRHQTPNGARWAADGKYLTLATSLAQLLGARGRQLEKLIAASLTDEAANGDVLAPIDAAQEVWACGVTYLRSRDARMAESTQASIYDRVYVAERPEIFFKAGGARVRGPGQTIAVRGDSTWDVPEPELTLVVNAHNEIVGYTAGNDVSSRSIEGENPLYLPQAKTYTHSCALGPAIQLCAPKTMRNLAVHCKIARGGKKKSIVFAGEANTSQLKRNLDELVEFATRALDFPAGLFLMTGTCVVPDEKFTLKPDDVVTVNVGVCEITNTVVRV